MDDREKEQTPSDRPIPLDLIRAYAAGQISWSELRAQTGVEDFREVLQALGQAGLRLPRASRDRPTNARLWLRETLARQASGERP
ncbi:hypothetical protein ACFQX4_17925 [Roseomonas sp. GCM10028921]